MSSSSSSPGFQISRRRLLTTAGVATAFGLLRFAPEASANAGPQSYSASWSSVDQHPPAPAWFQDAKFGIYYHWGAFSVPAFGNEWYPRNMYNSGSAENQHHIATYGDPSVWGYQNFINGAYNKAGQWTQFAPKPTSAGGNWDPNAWASLFKAAGARFAGPVAEHHDGFSMWNSQVNPWNSVAKGPKLDLLAQHAQAIRAQGLKFMCSLHHAYHYLGYYQYVPAQTDQNLKILFGQQGTTTETQLWYNKLHEVITGYQPDMIWQDFDLSNVTESYRLQFLADYYNAAVSWNKDVVATYKDGFDTNGEVFDYERGGAGGIVTPYWLTDDSVSPSTWCYVTGITLYDSKTMLHSLIDHTSKGGNLLLNIAPMADGTIPSDQQALLLGMGDWLGRFGEAIYATRAWSTFGEGPTAMGGGSFAGPKAGTPQDIRFTRTQDNTVLYATTLGWQGGTTTITTLGSNQINLSNLVSVQLINNAAGQYTNLTNYYQDGGGLHINMPSSTPPFNAFAYVFKLTFSGQIPTLNAAPIPTGWVKVANVTTGLVLDSGGSVPSGSGLKQWSYNGSTNLQWQFVPLGGGWYKIVNNTNGMVADSWGNTANGATCLQAPWNGGNNQQWKLDPAGNGRYHIVNRGTNTALDGAGNSTVGSATVMWAENGSTNNEYTITAV
ncbi:MAG TPA: alpha-L-fucosidase [Actinocrinis sp.]|uniref:alpha-L-fucosidase n=1 Tax=Actinocrinis sp. TaxID=1920516 RepID=UPI002DDD66A5|nr:alpha-L-fucosidase [Actinocrinis sp.]HEV2346084.1 alpha-L-fucosidase [Actinocrinis sp.]